MKTQTRRGKRRAAKRPLLRPVRHPAEQYAYDVLSGDVVAGRLVRLACERYLRDLDAVGTPAFPYWFDREAAEGSIDFFSLCRHGKGREWRGKTIELSPWQQFINWNVFGWMRADGTRRFRYVYEETARKQGKSTKCAGVAIKLTAFDGEPGAEVYTAATRKEQAMVVFDAAKTMVYASEELRPLFDIKVESMGFPKDGCIFAPIVADPDALHGKNPHAAIVDEVHAHKTRESIDVLETGVGSRTNWLIWMITTAGSQQIGPAWEYRQHSVAVLEQSVRDEEFFCYIASLDKDDDWKDERNWIKANPNLGVSVTLEGLRAKYQRALDIPGGEPAFRMLHLNEWVGASKGYMPMDKWEACGAPFDPSILLDRPCAGGLDLAETLDLNAFCLKFPHIKTDPLSYYLWWFWAPGEAATRRERLTRMKYAGWARSGHIKLTPGERCDYTIVYDDIKAIVAQYKLVKEIGYDPANANMLVNQLSKDGVAMLPMRQGYMTLNAPTKAFVGEVIGGAMRHGNNPVVNWMASNLVMRVDNINHCIMPKKPSDGSKIDGISAAVMATGRAMTIQDKTSIYATRGMIEV